MAESFDFKKFVTEHKLSEATSTALEKEELTDLPALMLFQESFESDIGCLKISVAQRGILRKALKSLVATPTDGAHKDESKDVPPITTKDLQNDKDLNDLLQQIAKSDGAFNVGDLLNSDSKNPDTATGTSENAGKKTLFIKDFVTSNRVVPDDIDEKEIFSGSGSTVLMRSTQGTKVRTENVSIAQWTSANMRIMSKLMERGDIKSMQDVQDYMKYTEEIGDYFQIYTTPSVMLYDHRYRERQAKERFRWGAPDYHSVNFYLRPNLRNTNNFNVSGGKPAVVQKDARGQNLCRDYQTEGGCKRRICKFSHVCAAEGCRQNHPEFLHKLVAKSGSQQ